MFWLYTPMKKSALLVLLALSPVFNCLTLAKCAKGTVSLHARILNLPSTVTGPEVEVILRTSKGNFSGKALVANAEFTIEVPFETYSSTSFWHSDSCHTVPKFVEIRVLSNQKVLAQKRIGLKEAFVEYAPHGYSLKRDDLTIDILKDVTSNHAKGGAGQRGH
jgi:hypothetical protein